MTVVQRVKPRRAETATGGRDATSRRIDGDFALSVGPPTLPTPKEWKWSLLTSVARLESGHTPSRKHPEYWDGDVPWITLSDARPHHGGVIDDTLEHTNELGIANSSARLLPKDTVCLSRTASVGYVVVMGRDMATSQDFVNWVCSDELDPHFLKYLLLAEKNSYRRFSSGSVHQTIYFPEVKAFHICHPLLAEQRRIVGILDEAFAAIATARANTEKNLQNARELFDSFLDVTLDDESSATTTIRLGDVVSRLTNGYVGPTRDIYVDSGVPYLLARHVRNNRLAFDGNTFVTEAFNKKNSKSMLKSGDVLLVQSGHIGHSAVVTPDHEGHNCHAMIVITTHGDRLCGEYLSLFFNSSRMRSTFEQIKSGSTVPHLTCGAVRELKIPTPSLSTQRRLVSSAARLSSELAQLASLYQQKLTTLDALKQSLLHHAFTGQL